MKKIYITTPIYYVNDKPHIGHAYTTIAADVLARHYRHQKADVFFLTGTDEHGAKIAESAAKAGLEPKDFADEKCEEFALAWKNLNISYDYFVRTTDDRHAAGVQRFMQKLHDVGALYQDTYSGLYCVGCERFLTDKELVDGKCPDHKTAPKKIHEKNYFFKLQDYLPTLKDLVESDSLLIHPAERKQEVLGLFKQQLPDFSVSREKVKWGIPLPFDKKQNAYVWVEALQNYITSVGYGDNAEEYAKWWPADVHIMAKDIIKFHAIYWPAMLLAAGEALPKRIFAHGFFTIDGQKMSKTIGNVIDPNDLVARYGSDGARYLLLSQFPFGQDGDVKADKFDQKFNSDLANGLGNLVSRTATLLEKNQIEVPEYSPIDLNIVQAAAEAIESLHYDIALKYAAELIAQANVYIDREAPWKIPATDKPKLSEVLVTTTQYIRTIAEILHPFMPDTSRSITAQFAGPTVVKGAALFPRLDLK